MFAKATQKKSALQLKSNVVRFNLSECVQRLGLVRGGNTATSSPAHWETSHGSASKALGCGLGLGTSDPLGHARNILKIRTKQNLLFICVLEAGSQESCVASKFS